MKIKDKGNAMNLNQSTYLKIAEQYGDDIKPMTALSKDEPSSHINLYIANRVAREAAIILTNSNQRFKTKTDVYRAAITLGMGVLYNMYPKLGEDGSGYGADFYAELRKDEKQLMHMQMLDTCMDQVHKYLSMHRRGMFDNEKLERKVKDVVNLLPKDIRVLAKAKVKELMESGTLHKMREMQTKK